MKEERLIEFTEQGETYFMEEGALAELLDASVIYMSGSEVNCTLYVLCNDVFWWGTADGEGLPTGEVENLYKAWKSDPKWGVIKWVARKRNMRPQWPVARDMVSDGAWDGHMKILPSRTEDPSDHGWKNAPPEYQ